MDLLPTTIKTDTQNSDGLAGENPYCKLSNFEIEKKIGRGQFSVVYRARCKINNQVIALKKVQVWNDISLSNSFTTNL